MPTYQYHCRKCHQEMEAFQKITDSPLTLCPACKQPALERGVGGGQALFQFKGKGFYQTDYKAQPAGECCPCGKKPKGDCTSS